MRTIPILAAAVLIGLTAAVRAQGPNVPPPHDPALSRAPEFAAWTVTYKYRPREANPDPAAPPLPEPERPQTLSIQKTHKTYCEQLRLTSGAKSEKWVFENIQLMMPVGNQSIVAVSAPNGDEYPSPDYSDYSACDFQGLDWISLANYRGVEVYQGANVYRFEADGESALLSTDTQLPVIASDKTGTQVYTFGPPPTAELVPSKRFQVALETHKRGLQLLRRNPSTP